MTLRGAVLRSATVARKLLEESDSDLGNRKIKQMDMTSKKRKMKNTMKNENITENKTEIPAEFETEPPTEIETKKQQDEIDSDNEKFEADAQKVTSDVDSSLDSSNEDEKEIGENEDVAEISDDEKPASSDKEAVDDVTANKKDFEKDEHVEETTEDQDKEFVDPPTIADEHAESQTSLEKEEVEIELDINKEKEDEPTDDKLDVFVDADKHSNDVAEPIEEGDEGEETGLTKKEGIETINDFDGDGSNTEPVGDSKEMASVNDVASSVDFDNNTESAEDTDEDAAEFSENIDEDVEIEELESSDKEIEVIESTDDDEKDEEMVTVKDQEKVIHSTEGGETSEDGAVVADSTEVGGEGEEVEPRESEDVVNEHTDEVGDGDEIVYIEEKTEDTGSTENSEEVDPSEVKSEIISSEEVNDLDETGMSNDFGSSGDLKVKPEAEDDLDDEAIHGGLGDENEDAKEAEVALGDGEDLKLGVSNGADVAKADVIEIEISKNATEVLEGEISDKGTLEVEDSDAKDAEQENFESELSGGKEEGDTVGAAESKDDLEDQNEYGSETAVLSNGRTELDGDDDDFEYIDDLTDFDENSNNEFDDWLIDDEENLYWQETKFDDISGDEFSSNNIDFETEQTDENIIDASFDDDNWLNDESSGLAGPFIFALVIAAGLFIFWKKRSNYDSAKVGYRPVPGGARMKSHTK